MTAILSNLRPTQRRDLRQDLRITSRPLEDSLKWVDIFHDKTGKVVSRFRILTQGQLVVLSRFNQLELLQGAKNEDEWKMLDEYLSTQFFLETAMVSLKN